MAMSNTVDERVRQLVSRRTPFVRATVVRAQQPTSAHAGDEAILLPDGTIEGFVGGQCAQNSVRRAALGALQGGESVLLRVLPDGDLHFPEAAGASVVVNPCLSGGALEIFLEPQIPSPLIRICGSAPIAQSLSQLCELVGFEVEQAGLTEGAPNVTDTEGAPNDTDSALTETSAVVIASHGGAEAAMIRSALDAGVGYIGLVASRVRGASVLAEVVPTDAERLRIHTPVGLDIGAKTSAEIAVSIVAELIAAIRGGDVVALPRTTTVPDEAVDPFCGMTVTIGPDTVHATRADVDHWFCSTGCREAYLSVIGSP